VDFSSNTHPDVPLCRGELIVQIQKEKGDKVCSPNLFKSGKRRTDAAQIPAQA
jgi:hypothetical protein